MKINALIHRAIVLFLFAHASGLATVNLDFSDPAKIPAPPPHAIGFPNRAPDFDARPGFRNPPPGYGEVGFYWWLGDPLTKERLAWQLDQLARVDGVMGLQINYAHSDRGGMSYGLTFPSEPPLFSPPWWKLYGWFMSQAKARGMAVSLSDYTLGVGQGWSVDELLKQHPDLQGFVLKSDTKDAEPGQELAWALPAGTVSLMAYRFEDGRIVPGSGRDLRGSLHNDKLQWRTPAGRWRAVAVRAERVVPSLDPMHPQSGAEYARHFFGQFTDRFPHEGGRGLNWFFSDELEFRVNGHLWTPRFAAEFHRRKDYDIIPELPALFTDVGPRTPKVRLDFSDVQVALTEEGFFKPVFDWHQQRGMIYGCDHGGRGRNVVEFGDYFRTQRWNQGPGCDQPGLGSDLIKNKVASSIAHLYLRPRTWLEGYYGSGWGTSTAQLTDATFRNFVMGQNLLTLHGLYYSTHGGWWEWAPPCNHFRMPHWPHMREFFACVKRLSFLLSQGYHRCDVAIVYPVAPMEAGLGGDESVQTAFRLGEHLYRRGIDFDFMDFESLARAKVEGKELRVSGERYRALVLPAMRAVRWSTLEKAAAFARNGGLVIALGALPEASDRAGRNDSQLDALVKQTLPLPSDNSVLHMQQEIVQHQASGVGVAVQSPEQAAEIVTRAFPRDFDCLVSSDKGAQPQVMHRRIGPRDVYAVYGVPAGSECSFRATGKVEWWDPWTGKTHPLRAREQKAGRTQLALPLSEKEIQLIVFSPGRAELESARDAAAPAAAAVVPLDDAWEFELKPTLDNRFGDFRWPPTPALIGAEARRFLYADETSPNPGWHLPQFDDSQWAKFTASFGPQFWKLGPLPDPVDTAALEAQLAQLEQVDPAMPVPFGGKDYRWQPYSFSWRYGIENDPGHQGYHGLKEEMHDEFIGLGKLRTTGTGTSYDKEDAGSRYYLWSSVAASSAIQASAVHGGMKPAAVWLNHSRLAQTPTKVQLNSGANPFLLRYDSPGCGYFVVLTGEAGASAASLSAEPAAKTGSLATSWNHKPGLLPFDTRPQEARPAGWYRFISPPGLRGMTFMARGKVQAWADGKEMSLKPGKQRPDGLVEFKAVVLQTAAAPVTVALRIEQARGSYAGAALPEPIALDCRAGQIRLGDWTKQGVLEGYSGGAWYRQTFALTPAQTRSRVTLDLGNLAASAEVRINGKSAGIRVAPPWKFDVTDLVKRGDNRVEVLVLSALGGHYTTIPTRYRGSLVSGLLGPVKIEIQPRAPLK